MWVDNPITCDKTHIWCLKPEQNNPQAFPFQPSASDDFFTVALHSEKAIWDAIPEVM